MAAVKAYEELIDFIAGGSQPEEVVAFQPSEAARARVWELVAREKSEALSPEEAAELAHYMQLEHIIRMAKARARKRLNQNYGVAAQA